MQQESGMSLTIKIGHYGEGNRNDESIKFETKVIKSSLCDYSDVYILAVKVIGGNINTNAVFIDCAPLSTCDSYKWWTYWYCWQCWHYNAYAQFDWI